MYQIKYAIDIWNTSPCSMLYTYGLVQDCSVSIANALELPQSCARSSICTVYPKKYAHGFCFAVLCCGYTLTDFPISIRLTSLAMWQSSDCPSASKATVMNMDKYFMWIHYERLHNHNKATTKPCAYFLGYTVCTRVYQSQSGYHADASKSIKLSRSQQVRIFIFVSLCGSCFAIYWDNPDRETDQWIHSKSYTLFVPIAESKANQSHALFDLPIWNIVPIMLQFCINIQFLSFEYMELYILMCTFLPKKIYWFTYFFIEMSLNAVGLQSFSLYR